MNISVKRIAVKEPWGRLPRHLWPDPFSILSKCGHLLRPPYPDLWIGCGRMSVPFGMAMRQRAPHVYVVQSQSPRAPASAFDLVIPPLHDSLTGENVFPIIGAPGRITAEIIMSDAEKFAPHVSHLGAPRLAVLIGGGNKAYAMGDEEIDQLIGRLKHLVAEGAGLMITTSRRTAPRHKKKLRASFSEDEAFVWNGRPVSGLGNPYFGMLGLADHILVTVDSVNMATEAAATGKPVYLFSLPGKGGKFAAFHEQLINHGAARMFIGELIDWVYDPLLETDRAAAEIIRRWQSSPK